MPRTPRPESALTSNAGLVEQLLRDSLTDGDIPSVKRPWAIKGIDESTIQLCKLAARGRGMKINRWVASALCQAAQTQFGQPAQYGQPTEPPAHGIDVLQLLDRISRLEGEVQALSKSHAAIVSAVVAR